MLLSVPDYFQHNPDAEMDVKNSASFLVSIQVSLILFLQHFLFQTVFVHMSGFDYIEATAHLNIVGILVCNPIKNTIRYNGVSNTYRVIMFYLILRRSPEIFPAPWTRHRRFHREERKTTWFTGKRFSDLPKYLQVVFLQ